MATFAAPADANVGSSPRRGSSTWRKNPLGCRLMAHFAQAHRGRNVYILSDETVTETDPEDTTVFWFAADGSPYVTHTFWGGHVAEAVTSAEATLLTNAGYSVT